MLRLLSRREALTLDRRAQEEFHIPGEWLMEEAAQRMAQALGEEFWGRKVLFLAGGGHNGGDALACARSWTQNRHGTAHVALWTDGLKELTSRQRDVLLSLGVSVTENPDVQELSRLIDEAGLVVDGLFGIGLDRPLGDPWREVFAAVGRGGRKVVALDAPSGLWEGTAPDDPVLSADVTLTVAYSKDFFHFPVNRPRCGQIRVLPVGFPLALKTQLETGALAIGDARGFLAESMDLFRSVAPLDTRAYKNTRGHTGVVAGSSGMTGAALLAGFGAQAARSGLVTLVTDEGWTADPAMVRPSLMHRSLKDPLTLADAIRGFDAVVAGPGWGRGPQREQELQCLLQDCKRLCLDADALHAAARLKSAGLLSEGWGSRAVLTPHPGELAALSGLSKPILLRSPLEAMRELADFSQAVVVLKGADTFVMEKGGRYVIVEGSNPALGCAGSGDVLAGLTAGLMAQGTSRFEAALGAVMAHQEAGRRAFRERGFFSAEAIADTAARVMGEIQTRGGTEDRLRNRK